MGTRFWRWVPNSLLGITVACLLLPGLSPATHSDANPSASARQEWGPFEVGFSTIRLNLAGSQGEARPLDLLVWYAADGTSYRSGVSPDYYKPRLYGVTLDPFRWDPLSWQIRAEHARSGVAIDATGSSFPLLIFSPANAGDPHTGLSRAKDTTTLGSFFHDPASSTCLKLRGSEPGSLLAFQTGLKSSRLSLTESRGDNR